MWWALGISKAYKVDEKRPFFIFFPWRVSKTQRGCDGICGATEGREASFARALLCGHEPKCSTLRGVSHDEGQSRTQQWEFGMVGGMCWSCLMNRVKSSWLRGWWFSVVFWWFGWPLSTGRNEWASSEWWNFWVKSVDGSSATSLNRWSLSILVGAGNGNSKPKYGKPNIKSLSDRGTAIVPPFATCLQEKIKNTWRSIQ